MLARDKIVSKEVAWLILYFASNVFHNPTEAHYYRPIFNSLLRAEHSFWGFRPLGYHLVNLLFHVACALELNAKYFLTFDERLQELASAAGLKLIRL